MVRVVSIFESIGSIVESAKKLATRDKSVLKVLAVPTAPKKHLWRALVDVSTPAPILNIAESAGKPAQEERSAVQANAFALRIKKIVEASASIFEPTSNTVEPVPNLAQKGKDALTDAASLPVPKAHPMPALEAALTRNTPIIVDAAAMLAKRTNSVNKALVFAKKAFNFVKGVVSTPGPTPYIAEPVPIFANKEKSVKMALAKLLAQLKG